MLESRAAFSLQQVFTSRWKTQPRQRCLLLSCVCQRESLARTGGPYIDYLPGKVRDGSMNESVLDLALRHTVGLRFRLGLFVSLSRVDCLLAEQTPCVLCRAIRLQA